MGNKLSFVKVLEGEIDGNAREKIHSFDEMTFEKLAMGLGTKFKNIIVMTGAGISVNAGSLVKAFALSKVLFSS
jgi:hypothetical protein